MTRTRDVAGRRYALAIAELAREHGDFEAWGEALDGLEALTASATFVDALQADGMTDERLQAIVREVVPGIGQRQLNLVRLLRRKGRLGLGASIVSYFRDLRDEERGIVRAAVRTAVPLDDERRVRLVRALERRTGKQIELEESVEPGLLGGAVIRIGDRLIDGSTRGRLRRLRDELAKPLAASETEA